MKLQQKTALIFIGLLIVLMILVSVFSSIVILSSYADLEQQYTEKDLAQAVTRVDDETNTLSAIVSDWGPWDDAYNYVQGTKPDFIQTNLVPDTFNNLRVNVIIIADRKGGIVYSGAYNSSDRDDGPCSRRSRIPAQSGKPSSEHVRSAERQPGHCPAL